MEHIRTRFAPSPTGYMHVGNLRTALYAFLIAKKDGGSFILRIEDTDRERHVEGAEAIIYNTLRDVGLQWDEGPDIGGAYGPYVQSQRESCYLEFAKKLVDKGEAYYCFCGKERLAALHEAGGESARYDGHCRSIPADEARRRAESGEPYVIRQKMPTDGVSSFDDLVYGHIEVPNSELEDQILVKSDGMPTYNFANVIDDHLMDITHVVRGNEYLSSTPKYNLLYRAFGWQPPQYIHCPPVMKDAQHKLSKRNGDASYQDLVAKGYLPDAIINYLALLGWSPKGEREIYSLEELKEEFSIDGISRSPSIFDAEKLRYINGEYIRALSPERFVALAKPFIRQTVTSDINYDVICAALQPRTEILSDIPEKLTFIDRLPDYGLSLYENRKMKTNAATALAAIDLMLPVLEQLDDYSPDSLHQALFALIEREGCKNGYMLWPLRVALSGLPLTPGGGIELAATLGKQKTVERLHAARNKLAAAGN